MEKVFKIVRNLFQCNGYIEVTESNNTIKIVIEKHLSKVSIKTKNISIHVDKIGNNRTAKTILTITLNEVSNEIIHNLIQELTLIISDNYKSINDIKKEVKI